MRRNLKKREHLQSLGIILDYKLNFKEHFNKVYDKAKKGLNGLIMIKNLLNYRTKLNIYHSLIHSHLSYGAIIRINNLSKKQLNMLKTLQKKSNQNSTWHQV